MIFQNFPNFHFWGIVLCTELSLLTCFISRAQKKTNRSSCFATKAMVPKRRPQSAPNPNLFENSRNNSFSNVPAHKVLTYLGIGGLCGSTLVCGPVRFVAAFSSDPYRGSSLWNIFLPHSVDISAPDVVSFVLPLSQIRLLGSKLSRLAWLETLQMSLPRLIWCDHV